jgi:Na+/H+ antiporter NhaA
MYVGFSAGGLYVGIVVGLFVGINVDLYVFSYLLISTGLYPFTLFITNCDCPK